MADTDIRACTPGDVVIPPASQDAVVAAFAFDGVDVGAAQDQIIGSRAIASSACRRTDNDIGEVERRACGGLEGVGGDRLGGVAQAVSTGFCCRLSRV